MTRFYLALVFSGVCLAGLGLILYAILAGRDRRSTGEKDTMLGFSDSETEPRGFDVLDLDTGHEGLQHKEKEAFNPGKHKPEPI
jgi:hypothetical protein